MAAGSRPISEFEAEVILRKAREREKAKAVLSAAEYPKGALLLPFIGAPLLVDYALPGLGLNDYHLIGILWVAFMSFAFAEWSLRRRLNAVIVLLRAREEREGSEQNAAPGV